MPYRNTAITICIRVINISTSTGKTGDAANITVRGVGDGAEFTPATPNITEVDATNLPGVYKVSLAAGENNYAVVMIGGKSSTALTDVVPYQWSNESDANLKQVNGGTTGATAGVLQLTQLKIDSTGAAVHPIDITADTNKTGINITASAGAGKGIVVTSANIGLSVLSSGNVSTYLHGSSHGLYLRSDNEHALDAESAGTGTSVILIESLGTDNDTLKLKPEGAGKAINATGQISVAPTNTNDAAIKLTGNGIGSGLEIAASTGGIGLQVRGATGVRVDGLTGPGVILNASPGTGMPAMTLYGSTATASKVGGPALVLAAASDTGGLAAGSVIELISDASSGGDTPGASAPHLIGFNTPSDWMSFWNTVTPVAVDTDILVLSPQGTGKAINATGQVLIAPTNTDDDAVYLTANGAGRAVCARGQIAVLPANTDDDAVILFANGTGKSINAQGQVFIGALGTDDDALVIKPLFPSGTGKAINVQGQIQVAPFITDDDAIVLTPNGAGKAMNVLGQINIAPFHTNDDALVLTPNGTGHSITAKVEGSVGIVESLRLSNAILGGKITGGGTTTETFRDVNDTKNRVVATVDAFGNRSALTLNLS